MNNKRPLNEVIVRSHAERLKGLDKQRRLILWRIFTDYPRAFLYSPQGTLVKQQTLPRLTPLLQRGIKPMK